LACAGLHFFDQETDEALAHGFWSVTGPNLVEVFGLARLRVRSNQIVQGNAPTAFVFLGVKEETEFRRTFQPGIIFAGEVGQLAQMSDDGRLKLFFE
jgi:hypothetical protein